MSSRTPYQIISDHYAASVRGDLPGMLADAAAEMRWTEMEGFPTAGTWVGVPQVIEHVFKPVGAAWDQFAFHLERLVDGGDTVVAIGGYSAVNRATGKPMKVRTVHVWDVADGKIQRFEQFTDTLLVQRAAQ
jgi:ketosteroid isomerase-like protein